MLTRNFDFRLNIEWDGTKRFMFSKCTECVWIRIGRETKGNAGDLLFMTGVHESVESFGCATDPIAMINLRPFRGSDSKLSKAIYAANSWFDGASFRNVWIIIGNSSMIPSWVNKEGLREWEKSLLGRKVKAFGWKSSPTQARLEFPMNNQPPRQRNAFRNKVSLRGF